MKLLLDTHAFIWIVNGGPLSQRAREAFLDDENDVYMSAASYWEISIKVSIGRLALSANWKEMFDQELLVNSIKWLPIEKEHCWAIMDLPMIHRDPFDRLLVAQAMCEKMALLTADANMQGYDVPIIW